MAITINGTSGISGVDGSATTPALQGSDTNTGLSFGTDEVNINTGGSTRATVDSSGRLLVGSTSQSASSRLTVQSNTSSSTGEAIVSLQRGQAATAIGAVGDALGTINFTDNADNKFASISGAVDAALSGGGGDYAGRLIFSTTTDNTSTLAERMRITSDGTVVIGDTTTSGTSGTGQKFYNTTASIPKFTTVTDDNTPGAHVITTYNANTSYNGARFILRLDGGIENYQSNNSNLCDEREKRDIVDLDSTWDCLKHWELKKFHYITDTGNEPLRYGVIAQQVAEHCPEVITNFVTQPGSEAVLNDEGTVIEPAQEEVVRMGVREQQMYWMAIKALQEAQTRIEALETRVAQLEGGTP